MNELKLETSETSQSSESDLNKVQDKPAVDIFFLLDFTGYMEPKFELASEKILKIISEVSSQYSGCPVRAGIVAYRDYSDSKQYEIHPFIKKIEVAQKILGSLTAYGGKDGPWGLWKEWADIHISFTEHTQKAIHINKNPQFSNKIIKTNRLENKLKKILWKDYRRINSVFSHLISFHLQIFIII